MSAKLVIGANGFLGSHVLRQLVAADDGSEIRAMVRAGANTISIDDLPVRRIHGDVFDTAALREAMTGCDVVYHCVVDARGWLRDPAPLFRTNVEGTRNVLDVAVEVPGCASSSTPAATSPSDASAESAPRRTTWSTCRR